MVPIHSPNREEYIIFRFSALGDVAMTVPYVYDVASGNPGSHIVFVTKPFMAKLFVAPPENLQVLPHDTERSGKWHDMIALARTLHKAYPRAVVVDMHDVLRTKLCRTTLRLFGHKVVVLRKPRKERKSLLSRKPTLTIPRELYVTPMTSLYADTLSRAGLSLPHGGRPIRFDQKRTRSIGIAPFAQHKGKRLPEAVLLRLIEALLEALPEHELILYGAPGREKETLATIANGMGARVRVSSASSLSGEIEEIAALGCMVSMDSANQHIAAMVATPVISLWGATHPAAGFVPFGQGEGHCLGVALDCRPCSIYGQVPCHRNDYACLYRFDVDEITKHVREVLSLPHNLYMPNHPQNQLL